MLFNKRGQFFIIISVVLAIAVFSITANPNRIQEAILFEEFEDLSNNYIHESEYVINYALESESNVETNLEEFTQKYLEFAKQRNPNLKLLYIYSTGENISLVNHFDGSVDIINVTDIPGSSQPLVQDISVEVGGRDFSYKVPVNAEEFGYEWYSANVPNSFNLSVAGFLHTFDLSNAGPEFRVIINLPGNPLDIPVGNGTGEIPIYSPESDTFKYSLRQVKTR
jgi:hypothetical protein